MERGFTCALIGARFTRLKLTTLLRFWWTVKGFILSIGKSIPEWNGVDMGVFKCTPVVFEAVEEVTKRRFTVTITDCMNWLIRHGEPVRAVDASGVFWLDIDTMDDVVFAEKVLGVLVLPQSWEGVVSRFFKRRGSLGRLHGFSQGMMA